MSIDPGHREAVALPRAFSSADISAVRPPRTGEAPIRRPRLTGLLYVNGRILGVAWSGSIDRRDDKWCHAIHR